MPNRIINFAEEYQPLFDPNVDCRYFLITGGRGSGKSYVIATHTGTDLINDPTEKNILYLRKTLASANISIIPEFSEKLDLLGYGNYVDKTAGEIENKKNASKIFFRGLQSSSGSNEANLKSIPNVGTVIIDEAQELDDEDMFDRVDLSIRAKGIKNRVILSLNPTGVSHWIYRRFFKDRGIADDFNGIYGDTCYIHTDYRSNIENLDDAWLAVAEECKRTNISKYRHIFLGYWRREIIDALWKQEEMIDKHRIVSPPESLRRIVVSIDPAVTAKKDSDETGIVVSAVDGAGEFYVLGDYSLKGSPARWADEAIRRYREYNADRIIAEVNNGGDLVEANIRSIDGSVSFTSVRATRGKIMRAEPIAALYEKGRVHHCGYFPHLEDQMCSYTGKDGEKSPDRLDALVWGLTELSGASRGSRIFATG